MFGFWGKKEKKTGLKQRAADRKGEGIPRTGLARRDFENNMRKENSNMYRNRMNGASRLNDNFVLDNGLSENEMNENRQQLNEQEKRGKMMRDKQKAEQEMNAMNKRMPGYKAAMEEKLAQKQYNSYVGSVRQNGGYKSKKYNRVRANKSKKNIRTKCNRSKCNRSKCNRSKCNRRR